MLLGLSDTVLGVITWMILLAEITFFPMSLFHKYRVWAWCATLAMHLSLLVLLEIPQISFGFILAQCPPGTAHLGPDMWAGANRHVLWI